MAAIPFDTHQHAKRLIASGMSPDAAAVEAEVMLEVMSRIRKIEAVSGMQDGELSTQIDGPDTTLDFVGRIRRAEMQTLRYEMEAHLHREMRSMTIWTGGMCLIVLITAVIIALPH